MLNLNCVDELFTEPENGYGPYVTIMDRHVQTQEEAGKTGGRSGTKNWRLEEWNQGETGRWLLGASAGIRITKHYSIF